MQPDTVAFDQKKRIASLWLLSASSLAAIVLIRPYWQDGPVHEFIEVSGLMLIFLAILGRLWSILYIGAHKNRKLVDIGPYSMTRNPLYLSSLAGILGVGLISGSLILAVSMAFAFYLVFKYTALREAAFLEHLFGAAYRDYAKKTPLFLPRLSLYRTATGVRFSQKALTSTFRDSLFLLALFPFLEGIEYLRMNGHLPILATMF
ncbi:methyltransferase family protein [Mycoplana rhizolycopersici]|uniref:Isoprenylcysteine carboxylmethyltransferase family protein n=1 Tax=Mycoplana rhizolycopersici TaxID=2746702 RepID=A0ABX2Q9G7_9HYPH|nr:isoprenylcysteine carboxylmethyltransferase family protein [Rhizobium rhizolycopersici]NVP54353.1 isoprenylcysteine carboxylmethyltransferase family protein [Rhizobium rhizolycopersici]